MFICSLYTIFVFHRQNEGDFALSVWLRIDTAHKFSTQTRPRFGVHFCFDVLYSFHALYTICSAPQENTLSWRKRIQTIILGSSAHFHIYMRILLLFMSVECIMVFFPLLESSLIFLMFCFDSSILITVIYNMPVHKGR